MDKRYFDLQDLEGEVWKSCSEFDGIYEVSNLGRVKSVERMIYTTDGREWLVKDRILRAGIKKSKHKSKYYFVLLSKDGAHYTREVHRLVAKEFVTGDSSLMVVHINHNTLDNRAVNLKYATGSEKSFQAWDIGNQFSSSKGKFGGDSGAAKPIIMFDIAGVEQQKFNSRIEAADWLIEKGIAPKQPKVNIMSAINKAVKGKYKTSYGFKWQDG